MKRTWRVITSEGTTRTNSRWVTLWPHFTSLISVWRTATLCAKRKIMLKDISCGLVLSSCLVANVVLLYVPFFFSKLLWPFQFGSGRRNVRALKKGSWQARNSPLLILLVSKVRRPGWRPRSNVVQRKQKTPFKKEVQC